VLWVDADDRLLGFGDRSERRHFIIRIFCCSSSDAVLDGRSSLSSRWLDAVNNPPTAEPIQAQVLSSASLLLSVRDFPGLYVS
jgi:hypothetical protein